MALPVSSTNSPSGSFGTNTAITAKFLQVAAIQPRHGGGDVAKYGPADREGILSEARRKPEAKV